MPLNIAISGSTGLVGSKLVDHFKSSGHQITRIIRSDTKLVGQEPCLVLDSSSGVIEKDQLEGHDVLIHLAGASIAGQKWTAAYKRVLFSSRVDSTKLLSAALAKVKKKPKVFLCASAIGYYGSHPSEESIDERSPLGHDFLAQLCHHWETATQEVQQAGIRVIHMRFGVVLSKNGGALAKMLLPFKLGIGGRLGVGDQMMSWVALDEIPSVIEHLIKSQDIAGAVNVVSPGVVSNAVFTKALGKALGRPTILPVPALAVKALFGEMGEALLLKGAKVLPKRLLDSGYTFKFDTINGALRHEL